MRRLLFFLLVLCHANAFSAVQRRLLPRTRGNTALIAVSPLQNEERPELLNQETNVLEEIATEAIAESDGIDYNFTAKRQYDWKDFLPEEGGFQQFLRWIITGASLYVKKESDEELQQNLASLARMLILLREYESEYGVPEFGGPSDQRNILNDIIKDLYGSGTPTWVLEAVVARMAEGLTGREGVEIMLLPHRAFVFYPETEELRPGTELIRMSPGFYIAKLGALESVTVRLASFAGNTKSMERVNAAFMRMPNKRELVETAEAEGKFLAEALDETCPEEGDLAKQILDLASESYGLFYFLNSPNFQEAINATDRADTFWEVEESTRNIFSRLAARETRKSMDRVRRKSENTQLYSPAVVSLFRVLSSSGACAMWFGGSFADMFASASLALVVAYMGSKRVLAFEERVLTDVASSLFVGIVAGLLSIQWPNTFCFAAIAVGGVLDLLQGFKVVFAVIEVMTKNVVTGTARFMEGILYTGLLSYTIMFGLNAACFLLSGSTGGCVDGNKLLTPANPVSAWFFPLILPLATMGWSGLFRPSYADLPLMAFHGSLAMCLNWTGVSSFVSAMCVTFSAGIISRFTGREALGNTFAGLYALTPGTYMATALLKTSKAGFVEAVLVSSMTIGLGAWTGTVLCSPTILGKTSGLNGVSKTFKNKDGEVRRPSMLCF